MYVYIFRCVYTHPRKGMGIHARKDALTTHLLVIQMVRSVMLERQGPVDVKNQEVRAILVPVCETNFQVESSYILTSKIYKS
jgi:hypothetical protein